MKPSRIQSLNSKAEEQTNWSYFYVNVIFFLIFFIKYFKYILML